MVEQKPNVLQNGGERSITLAKGEEYSEEFENPNGARVRCKVVSGKGEFALWKKGKKDRWVGNSYTISTGPGDPTTVHLKTLTAAEERALSEDPSLDISASSWGVYVKALGPGENKFSLKLFE